MACNESISEMTTCKWIARYERSGVSLSFVRLHSWLPAHNANGIRTQAIHFQFCTNIRQSHHGMKSKYRRIYRHYGYSDSIPMLLLEFPYTRTHTFTGCRKLFMMFRGNANRHEYRKAFDANIIRFRRNTCHTMFDGILPNKWEK